MLSIPQQRILMKKLAGEKCDGGNGKFYSDCAFLEKNNFLMADGGLTEKGEVFASVIVKNSNVPRRYRRFYRKWEAFPL